MRAADAYASLEALGRPVVSTRDAAVAWGVTLPTAARILARLADSGLLTKLRQGVWQIGRSTVDPAYLLPVLANPFPSYVSGWSALFRHGMIEQIPSGIFAVSLGRPKTIPTRLGRFEIHHVQPEVFGGFDGGSGTRAGVARPEKALFDTVYILSVRQGQVTLPELELQEAFDQSEVNRWVEAIGSERLRTITRRALLKLISGADRQSAP